MRYCSEAIFGKYIFASTAGPISGLSKGFSDSFFKLQREQLPFVLVFWGELVLD